MSDASNPADDGLATPLPGEYVEDQSPVIRMPAGYLPFSREMLDRFHAFIVKVMVSEPDDDETQAEKHIIYSYINEHLNNWESADFFYKSLFALLFVPPPAPHPLSGHGDPKRAAARLYLASQYLERERFPLYSSRRSAFDLMDELGYDEFYPKQARRPFANADAERLKPKPIGFMIAMRNYIEICASKGDLQAAEILALTAADYLAAVS